MTIATRILILLAVAACDSKRVPPAPETVPKKKPPPPPAPKGSVKPPSPVQSIAMGMETVAVRLADGSAWTWGHIADAPDQRQPYPIKLRLEGAVRLSGGGMSNRLCGLMPDGTGTCSPPDEDLRDIIAISPAYVFSCAVMKKGSVQCWGQWRDHANDKDAIEHSPVLIKGVKNAIDVDVGGAHACALLADHHVACWGDNQFAELGIDSLDLTRRPSAAVVKGIDRVEQLAVGGSSTCVLRDDATVWCWGFGILGQLGNGSSTDTPKPTQIEKLTDVVELKAGESAACARLKTGKVTCWGNDQTTRETGAVHAQYPHEIEGIDDATQLAVGDYNGCVVRATGVVSCWGDPTYGVNGDVKTTDVTDVRWLP